MRSQIEECGNEGFGTWTIGQTGGVVLPCGVEHFSRRIHKLDTVVLFVRWGLFLVEQRWR